MIEWILIPADELDRRIEAAAARALAAHVPKPAPLDDGHRRRVRVLDLIALFGRSKSTVVTRIVCHPTFPKPCQQTGTTHRHRLWWEDECVAWVRANPNLMPGRRRTTTHK